MTALAGQGSARAARPGDGRTHVCQLVQGLAVGGLEIMVLNLVSGLDSSRFRSTVCCFDTLGSLAGEARARGVDVHLLTRARGVDWRYPFRLAGFLRRQCVDVLQAHNPTAFFYGALAGRLARVPCVVYTEHGRDLSAGWKVRLAHRVLARLVDRVVAVGEHGRRLLESEGVPATRITRIYNGIDPAPYAGAARPEHRLAARAALGLPGESPVVGIVARLDPIKNHEGLLRAFALVLDRLPSAILLVVGDGPPRAELEALARALGLAEAARFLGTRSDIPRVLAALDLFVLPSHSEGLSLTLVEASAAARPIVATDVGGNGEVVEHGVSGLLVPRADVPALANALVSLLADAPRARAMGAAGRARFERQFTLASMVGGYASLYTDCLGER